MEEKELSIWFKIGEEEDFVLISGDSNVATLREKINERLKLTTAPIKLKLKLEGKLLTNFKQQVKNLDLKENYITVEAPPQTPEQQKVKTVQAYINTPLPFVPYKAHVSSSTKDPFSVKANLEVPPIQNLRKWEDFLSQVSLYISTLDGTTDLNHIWKQESPVDLYYETEFYSYTETNVFDNLNRFATSFWFKKYMGQETAPDFYSFLKTSQDIKPLFPIEEKYPHDIECDDGYSLLDTFFAALEKGEQKKQEKKKEENNKKYHLTNVKNSVNQIWCYMHLGHVKYGVLTTYQSWWFLKRDSEHNLFVSSALNYNSQNPSVFGALIYLCNCASTDGGSPRKPSNNNNNNNNDEMEQE